MANELTTIDVTQLPVATEVKGNDTLLLVRPNGDGTNTPMRVAGSALPSSTGGTSGTKKKKEQRIVIGRAIRPLACEQGNVENWYCYGYSQGGVVTVPINVKNTVNYDNDDKEYYKEIDIYFKSYAGEVYDMQYHLTVGDRDKSQITQDIELQYNIYGFRVDKYEYSDSLNRMSIWLSYKIMPQTFHSASTHHYFECGVRKNHVRFPFHLFNRVVKIANNRYAIKSYSSIKGGLLLEVIGGYDELIRIYKLTRAINGKGYKKRNGERYRYIKKFRHLNFKNGIISSYKKPCGYFRIQYRRSSFSKWSEPFDFYLHKTYWKENSYVIELK